MCKVVTASAMSVYNDLFDHRASDTKGCTWAGPVWGAVAGY